jgi:hypothetical protein
MSVASVGITQQFVDEVKAFINGGGGGGGNLDVKGQVKLYDSADVQQGFIQGLPDNGGEVKYQADNQILLTSPLIGVQGHMDLYPTGSSVAKGYIETKSGGMIISGDPTISLKPIVNFSDSNGTTEGIFVANSGLSLECPTLFSVYSPDVQIQSQLSMIDSADVTQGVLLADSAGALSLNCVNEFDIHTPSFNVSADLNVTSTVNIIDSAFTTQCGLVADTTGFNMNCPTKLTVTASESLFVGGLTTDVGSDITTGDVTKVDPLVVDGYSLNDIGNRLSSLGLVTTSVTPGGAYADGQTVQLLFIDGTYTGSLSIFNLFIQATLPIPTDGITIELGDNTGITDSKVGKFPPVGTANDFLHVMAVVPLNSDAGNYIYVSCTGAGAWTIEPATSTLTATIFYA